MHVRFVLLYCMCMVLLLLLIIKKKVSQQIVKRKDGECVTILMFKVNAT